MIKRITIACLVLLSVTVAGDTLSYFDEAELVDRPLVYTGNVVGFGVYFEIDSSYGSFSVNSLEMRFSSHVTEIVGVEWPLSFPMIVSDALSDSAPGLNIIDTLAVLVYDSTELLYPNWTRLDLSNNPKLENLPRKFWLTSYSLSMMVWDSISPSGHSRHKTLGPERWSTNYDQAIRISYDKTLGIEDRMTRAQPLTFKIKNPYPNPFNPSTTIEYDLPEQSDVSLIVYDIAGRDVQTVVSRSQSPGSYQISWNGTNRDGQLVAGGMYFARLLAGEYSRVIKMVYLK